jgi:hypothetical protein
LRIPTLFDEVQFIGQAEGDRLTYYVFKSRSKYLVASPTQRGTVSVNVIDLEAPEVILKRFAGARVTSQGLQNARRPDLFSQPFDRLNSLYVMVALKKAKKLKKKLGKAMVFKISSK